MKEGNYKVTDAKEQGNDKYNGVFNFNIDTQKKNLKGIWASND